MNANPSPPPIPAPSFTFPPGSDVCCDVVGEADISVAVLVVGIEFVVVLSAKVPPLSELTVKFVVGPIEKAVELRVLPSEVPELRVLRELEVLELVPEDPVGAT